MRFTLALRLFGIFTLSIVSAQADRIDQELGPRLSDQASIVHQSSAAPSWTEYYAPRPGTVINVAEERDVMESVKYCIENDIAFLARSGGHGWGKTFNIGQKDVLINLRGLNKIAINKRQNTVTFGGGAIIGEVVEVAYRNGLQVVLGNCNCVGAGHILGGGYTRLMSVYGMAIDNILSVNLVTATGDLRTITPQTSPDLWFALRGAGANFGIVTSLTMRAYPARDNQIWTGGLTFEPAKIERVIEALNKLDLSTEMFVNLFYAASPAPSDPSRIIPSVALIVQYNKPSIPDARAAFASLFELGPLSDTTKIVPFNEANADSDGFCTKGERKTGFTAGLKRLDPGTMRRIWDEYVDFFERVPGAQKTILGFEGHSHKVSRQRAARDPAAYPHRDVNFVALIGPWWTDPAVDPEAERFGKTVRDMLVQNSGFEGNPLKAYVNYAHGDESLRSIYGDNLARLRQLKRQYDPEGRFNQFFALS